MKCKHNVAANTQDCITSFRGHTITGVIFNALPLRRRDLAAGTKTLIFNCGHGLTFAGNGSFWPEVPSDIEEAIADVREQLRKTRENLSGILELTKP